MEEKLRGETEKWLERVKKKRSELPESQHMKNIDAYISDSQHFLDNGDLIRAFEAVIWAWAWIEILEELKQL